LKLDKKSLRLYAVTDRTWVGKQTLAQQIEETLKAGTSFLQLREKELSEEEFLEEAIKIKKIAKTYHIPFVINDNVEIALKCNADGVHVGQNDMRTNEVRNVLGDDKIIGVSVQTVEQAKIAQSQGADYLGVGAVFNTSTKKDVAEVSYDTLKDICRAVTIPVIAIGGISINNIQKLKGSGIEGVAVVSAIFASDNITENTLKLLEEIKDIVNE
jgi:thiamine-phosphate pyrophosphorylase